LLDQIRRYCPVCFTLDGRRVDKHTPFVDCRDQPSPVIPKWCDFSMGWQENKRVTIQASTTAWKYCHFCALPFPILPPDHKALDLSKVRSCMYRDSITLVVWCVFHTEQLFRAMKAEVNCPIEEDSSSQVFHTNDELRNQWALWLGETPDATRWTNAIEVFSWLCKFRGLD
jgi:hypothetical protein